MPAIIPLIVAGVSTAGSVYAAKKASSASKLDPTQQAAQNDAAALANQRMQSQQPLFDALTRGAMGRLPASMSGQSPSYGSASGMPAMPTGSSGLAQAFAAMAQRMPAPQQPMRWGGAPQRGRSPFGQ